VIPVPYFHISRIGFTGETKLLTSVIWPAQATARLAPLSVLVLTAIVATLAKIAAVGALWVSHGLYGPFRKNTVCN
jgi:hypothetical protein